MTKLEDIIYRNVETLTCNDKPEYRLVPRNEKQSLPNTLKLREIITIIKDILFPGFFSDLIKECESLKEYQALMMHCLNNSLKEQIENSLRFCPEDAGTPVASAPRKNLTAVSAKLSEQFMEKLPEIKRLLCTDVQAMFDNDPAAKNKAEVIICYPSIQAMIHYRVGHELLILGIPLLPRIITEMAHSATGIDIHPGAQIGEYFSIDHGTGVVIGETTIIGSHVHLYKGVTLGAKNFVLDECGNPVNVPRHPIIEDNVVIYSNATVLGRITIGHDSVIGGNVWLTTSVAPHSRIVQQKASNE
ncbi:MAG: serine acetyltransferase [Tannerella sp.]|jgi:serine O-acetyltransferase|nr:serine acetyltransferase [Tannerella sp.]